MPAQKKENHASHKNAPTRNDEKNLQTRTYTFEINIPTSNDTQVARRDTRISCEKDATTLMMEDDEFRAQLEYLGALTGTIESAPSAGDWSKLNIEEEAEVIGGNNIISMAFVRLLCLRVEKKDTRNPVCSVYRKSKTK